LRGCCRRAPPRSRIAPTATHGVREDDARAAIVYAGNWSTEVSRKLWVLNQGGVGHSRLDIDAIVLLDLQ